MFLISCILPLFATNYYVDLNGNDNNSGLITAPWATMSKVSQYSNSPGFNPGDQILFKKGQIFSDPPTSRAYNICFRSSGSTGNPIVIGSYGDGEIKPVLTCRLSLPGFSSSGNWSDEGNNIWKMSMAQDPYRVWLSATEYPEANPAAPNPVSLIDRQYRWYYNANSHYLYVWSPTNPANYYGSSLGLDSSQHVLLIMNKSYITVQDLDFSGGFFGALCIMQGAHDLTIQNCIVRDCHHAIFVSGIDSSMNPVICYNIYIKNNLIDSQASFSYNHSYENIGEGVCFCRGVTDSEICGNILKDWGHSCINILADSYGEIKRCKMFNNKIYGVNISYCRGLGFNALTDNLCADNEFYNNLIKYTTAPSQINCSNLYFHDNTIDTVINSPAHPSNSTGQGLVMYMTPSWESAKNNIIEYNTITNCDDVGIGIWNDVTSSVIMSGNVIQNNSVKNCCLNVKYYRNYLSGTSIEIRETITGAVTGNQFKDNELSDGSSNDVSYKGTPMPVSVFNQQNGNYNNVISGNH